MIWWGKYPCNHLRLEVVNSTTDTSCLDAKACRIIKITGITAVNEMNLWMRWYFMLYTHLYIQSNIVVVLKGQENVERDLY